MFETAIPPAKVDGVIATGERDHDAVQRDVDVVFHHAQCDPRRSETVALDSGVPVPSVLAYVATTAVDVPTGAGTSNVQTRPALCCAHWGLLFVSATVNFGDPGMVTDTDCVDDEM